MVKELKRSFFETLKEYPTLWIEKLATDEDHIHFQIEVPPNMTVSATVQALKIQSSLHLKRRFKFIREMYIDGSIWSVGYFVSTVCLKRDIVNAWLT